MLEISRVMHQMQYACSLVWYHTESSKNVSRYDMKYHILCIKCMLCSEMLQTRAGWLEAIHRFTWPTNATYTRQSVTCVDRLLHVTDDVPHTVAQKWQPSSEFWFYRSVCPSGDNEHQMVLWRDHLGSCTKNLVTLVFLSTDRWYFGWALVGPGLSDTSQVEQEELVKAGKQYKQYKQKQKTTKKKQKNQTNKQTNKPLYQTPVK